MGLCPKYQTHLTIRFHRLLTVDAVLDQFGTFYEHELNEGDASQQREEMGDVAEVGEEEVYWGFALRLDTREE